MPDASIEIKTAPTTVLVDSRTLDVIQSAPATVVTTSRSIEIDKRQSKTIEVSRKINYVSDKISFTVGTTNGTPVSVGDKQAYGTRFGNGTITQWAVTADDPTTAELRVQRSSSFPTFSDIITINMVNQSRVSGYSDIDLLDMDVLNLLVVSNTASTRFVVELTIR